MSSYRVLVRSLLYALPVVLSASVAAAQEFGTLSIQARPAGAEILIDGEHWTGSGETGPLTSAAGPGVAPHRGPRAGPADIRVRRDDPGR